MDDLENYYNYGEGLHLLKTESRNNVNLQGVFTSLGIKNRAVVSLFCEFWGPKELLNNMV